MEFRVYFKHMPSSLAAQAYAEKKIGERLEKYALRVLSAQLTFAFEHGVYGASCHVTAEGRTDLVIEHDDPTSMVAAIDGLADKLDARLRRTKEKLRSHRAKAAPDLLELLTPWAAQSDDDAVEAIDVR